MSGQRRRRDRAIRSSNGESPAQRMFGGAIMAGAAAYVRTRDLPRLLALWPHEIEDESPDGNRRLLARLRHALRAERRRARSGHWSYDLNRHLGLLSAYKGELARLRLGSIGLSRIARSPRSAAAEPGRRNIDTP